MAAQHREQLAAASEARGQAHRLPAGTATAASFSSARQRRAADQLGADVALATAALAVDPHGRGRRTWGLDPRLLVADLRRMQRETATRLL